MKLLILFKQAMVKVSCYTVVFAHRLRAVDKSTALSDYFSHFKLATVQDVLQADWQEFAHSLHPGLSKLFLMFVLLIVFICFILNTSSKRILCYFIIYDIRNKDKFSYTTIL